MVGAVASFGAGIWAAHSLDANLVFVFVIAIIDLILAVAWSHGRARIKGIVFFVPVVCRRDAAYGLRRAAG